MKKVLLICLLLLLAVSCSLIEEDTSRSAWTPVPFPNTKSTESSGDQETTQYKETSQITQEAAIDSQNDVATSTINLPEGFVLNSSDETTRIITELAENGDKEAQFHLGEMYCSGKGVPQDYKEAVKWYTKAAEQGYAPAQVNLGAMYELGDGVPQDYKESVKWYTKAAEQGDSEAQCQLGIMHQRGEGVSQDYKESVKWYTMAAEQGNAEAQFYLGVMYSGGQGVPQDYKEAVKWFTKAAAGRVGRFGHLLHNNPRVKAQFSLGVMYELGEGIPQDHKEAVKWYTKAAQQGLSEAQHNLGLMYYSGKGVPQDYKESVKWYTMAAEQELPSAQCKLGLMYYYGEGVLEDYVEAYKWLMLAAMKGEDHAQQIKQRLRQEMTPGQIEEAQRRAREFLAKVESPKEDRKSVENLIEQPIVSQGTGFLFSETGLVATNYHVVAEKQDIRVHFPQTGHEFRATVELKDTANDLVVLRMKNFTYQGVSPQEIPFGIKRSSGVQLGEEVFTLGFPLGRLLGESAKFSDGTISSLSGLLGSANLFQINNPIQPGNSGGPLFNRDGNLIGVVVAMLDAKFFYENLDTIPQNVNFAIKSDYLINLMCPFGKAA